MNRTTQALIVILMVNAAYFVTLRPFGRLHGKVVDGATGRPIQGAIVAFAWWQEPIIAFHGGQLDFQKVVECETGPDGEFSVSTWRGINWNPFTYTRSYPDFVVFKPDYLLCSPAYPCMPHLPAHTSWPGMIEAMGHGVVMVLSRPSASPTMHELGKMYSPFWELGGCVSLEPPACIPRSELPLLTKAEEQARAGVWPDG